MDIRPSETLDLAPFGVDGKAVIGKPLFADLVYAKNEVGKRIKITRKNGVDVSEPCPAGDLELIMLLQYVWEAPFPKDLDGFLAFAEKMDKARPGSALEMFQAISEVVSHYNGSDEKSPFPN